MQPDLSTAIVILLGVLLGIGALLFALASMDPTNVSESSRRDT
jgi:hypothetical protein